MGDSDLLNPLLSALFPIRNWSGGGGTKRFRSRLSWGLFEGGQVGKMSWALCWGVPLQSTPAVCYGTPTTNNHTNRSQERGSFEVWKFICCKMCVCGGGREELRGCRFLIFAF